MSSMYERRPGDFESHAEVSAYNALYPEDFQKLSQAPGLVMFSLVRP